MEFLLDPTIWAGLATLIVLEIVLGIDNLIFIAILSDKLPPSQRKKARIVGLILALGMRLILLVSISWLTSLTSTLASFGGHDFSWRDLIMITGGAFLLFKGTMELHEKLEGTHAKKASSIRYAHFWPVIVQIVVLDGVFSLDAVVTAVGMTDHIPVMIVSVCIAMFLMILASNKLMDFVSAHPTVVILCLGFLLMIGFSLIIEGVGYHVPKGYLYAAIGFSVLIEACNQLAQRNRRKNYEKIDARTRVSEAVIGLLGMKSKHTAMDTEISALAPRQSELGIFKPQERLMVGRVLRLASQPVREIMTPRNELYWIDLEDSPEVLTQDIKDCPYSCILVAKEGAIDEPLGILLKKDIADALLMKEESDVSALRGIIRQPLFVPESVTVLQTMESFRKKRMHVAFVIDEYGALEGLVTLTDVLESIAGDMPEDHEDGDNFQFERQKDGSYIINGTLGVHELKEIIGHDVDLPKGDYSTAAGVALNVMKRLPQKGDSFHLSKWLFVIEDVDGRRISRIKIHALKEIS